MHIPNIDLPKVANVAGSAVAMIIATMIFLSWITARYVPAFDRYRALADEYRGKEQNERKESLRQQIEDYRDRLWYLSRATDLACIVMVFAVLTILLASSTVTFPPPEKMAGGEKGLHQGLAILGCVTMLVAFLLDIVAIGCIMLENRIDRRAIDVEVRDLRDVAVALNGR